MVVGSAQEAAHTAAGGLEGLGGPAAQFVDAAVHVGTDVPVEVHLGFDDHRRFLGGGRIVQVDQGVPVHPLAQDGKVTPHRLQIEAGSLAHGAHSSAPGNNWRSSRRRRSSWGTRSRMALAKAMVSTPRACSPAMPRLRR